jgi:hypothetical protein
MPRTDEQSAGEPWVVWSYEHDAWWGADHSGYHTDLMLAGLYTAVEAQEIERNANRGRIRNEEAMPLRHALTGTLSKWGVAIGRDRRVAGRVLTLLDESAEQRKTVRELRVAGSLLSNFAFNLEQRPTLDARAVGHLRECRLAWDRTLDAHAGLVAQEPNRNAGATIPETPKATAEGPSPSEDV